MSCTTLPTCLLSMSHDGFMMISNSADCEYRKSDQIGWPITMMPSTNINGSKSGVIPRPAWNSSTRLASSNAKPTVSVKLTAVQITKQTTNQKSGATSPTEPTISCNLREPSVRNLKEAVAVAVNNEAKLAVPAVRKPATTHVRFRLPEVAKPVLSLPIKTTIPRPIVVAAAELAPKTLAPSFQPATIPREGIRQIPLPVLRASFPPCRHNRKTELSMTLRCDLLRRSYGLGYCRGLHLGD